MAHIHFDAKFRVDSVRELLGDTADDDAFESGTDKSAVLERHAKGRGVASWQAAAQADDDEQIYALFKTAENPDTSSQPWDSRILMNKIKRFESDARNRPVENVGRLSAYPRILPLRDVLKAGL